jgi:hypothetical protein
MGAPKANIFRVIASGAKQSSQQLADCFVALLLAMTMPMSFTQHQYGTIVTPASGGAGDNV